MEMCLCFKLFLLAIFPTPLFSITTDYLTQVCNVTSKTLETSLRLESSTAIAYNANTACFYHVVTDAGKLVFLLIRTFDLETKVKGVCVDYVNIHDGGDVSAATLNTTPLCGRQQGTSTYTSTGNEMTIYFQADATGQSLGFEFLFSAVTTGTCLSSQTSCVNASVCIDSSLKCNTADECGDNTDEAGCTYPSDKRVQRHPAYIIIISTMLGGIVFVTLCVVIGYIVWRNNKWRWYMHKSISADKVELHPTTYNTAYPVTKVYYMEKFQNMYADPTLNQQQSETYSYQQDSYSGSENRTSSESFA